MAKSEAAERHTDVNRTNLHSRKPSRRSASRRNSGLADRPGGTRFSRRRPLASFLPGAVLVTALILACIAPALASASFTRPFLRQITGTSAGPFGEMGPLGVAVDGEDDLWVGEYGTGRPPFPLDEFGSVELGDPFLQSLELQALEPPAEGVTLPQSLAVNHSTGIFYLAGENTGNNVISYVEAFAKSGAFIKRFGPFDQSLHLAVDNTTEPTAGSVYVSSNSMLTKLDSTGEPVNFSLSEQPGHPSYLSANQITGTPSGSFAGSGLLGAIAVDPQGDIYMVTRAQEIDEYAPSGLFIRSFDGTKTPGVGENQQHGGFGGSLGGIAVDPLNDHVLVAVTHHEYEKKSEGAVDEFDASGQFIAQITESASGQRLHGIREIAVDSHGDLYLVDRTEASPGETNPTNPQHAIDVYGPGHFLPSLELAEASERKPTSAELGGSVDPEGLALSDCHFEYVPQSQFEASAFTVLTSEEKAPCVPGAGSIPADSEFHQVQAALSGLTSGTTYRYRLLATSTGELGGTAASAVLAFTAPHAPAIDSTFADNLSSTFADLRAQFRPLGADTSYYFQYVEAGSYEAGAEDPYAAGTTVPVIPAAVGSGGPGGGAEVAVLQQIGALAPSTTYHFRVVASNELGATPGPDRTFATLPAVSPGLSDNRAYELLTPPNKSGAEDMFGRPSPISGEFPNIDVGYPSDSGDGFLLETRAAFGAFPFSLANAYVFSRNSASGWHAVSLASPSLGGVQAVTAQNTVFDSIDLSRVAFGDGVGAPASAGGKVFNTELGPPGGPYATLSTDSAAIHTGAESSGETETVVAGASHDLSRVVLQSTNHTLAPGAALQHEGSHALYESMNGAKCEPNSAHCALLNVDNGGKLLSRCGAELGLGALSGGIGSVSADGTRAIFTAPDPKALNDGSGCWNGAQTNVPQLYSRSAGSTVDVSAPEAGVTDPSGPHPALYAGASEDGSKIFFLSEAELTSDDTGIHDPELYEYDFEKPESERLSRISAGESGAAAGVWTVPAISADGAAVYFTAAGRLTAIAPATVGEEVNLYRYDTRTDATTYVATINERDYPADNTGAWWHGPGQPNELPNGFALSPEANWNTTPDGRYLLFGSTRGLLGNSTAEAPGVHCVSPGYGSDGHCSELYRYDSVSGELVCVSCDPSGAPPASNAEIARSAPNLPASGSPRAISDDGSYVFFDTADSLVPQDANGTLDVYQWHRGTVSLISSGHDSAPSFFLGSGADGANVFFGTHARLVPQDTDTAGDLYDARIGGGFPPPPSREGLCEGDACQNLLAAPSEPTLATSVPSGRGNALPPSGKQHKKHKGPHRKKHKGRHARAASIHRGGSR